MDNQSSSFGSFQANWKIDLNPLDKAFEQPTPQLIKTVVMQPTRQLHPQQAAPPRIRVIRATSDVQTPPPVHKSFDKTYLQIPQTIHTQIGHTPRRSASLDDYLFEKNKMQRHIDSSFEQISDLMPPRASPDSANYQGISFFTTTACPVQSSSPVHRSEEHTSELQSH